MNKTIASAFYDRIDEASSLADQNAAVLSCRLILENIFKDLTAGSKRSFDGLYARTHFIFNEMQVKRELREQTHRLRIFCNKVVHGDIPPSFSEVATSIKTLCLIVAYFYKSPIPTKLAQSFVLPDIKDFNKPADIIIEKVIECRLLITIIGPIQETEDGKSYFTIKALSDEIGEEDFELQLWKSETSDFTKLQPLLAPFQTLTVYNFKKTPRRDNHFSSETNTQIVLEPDLLIDISELAECFSGKSHQPLLFLLKKLLPQDYNMSAFQGNMVNALLDAALINPALYNEQTGLKDVFREAVAEQAFQAAVYGKESLNKIYEDIKTRHWPNLRKVAMEERLSKTLHIEPTFFSDKYGIQGRLDLMVSDDTDKNKKDIYELKSGKSPNNRVWINHQMQVVGYNLLLRSAFGHAWRGTSAIFYSGDPNDCERNVLFDFILSCKLLEVRNIAVAWLLQLANEDYSVLNSITPELGEGQPKFQADGYSRFYNEYQFATPIAKAYYQSFISFTIREWLNAKIGLYNSSDRDDRSDGFSALWLNTEEEKIKRFSIITGLRCNNLNEELGLLSFRRTEQLQQHNFRPGDTVIVYPRNQDGRLYPLKQQILKGRLDKITTDEISVSLNNRQVSADHFKTDNEHWVLEHDIYESNFWTMCKSMFFVLSHENKDKLSLLLGERPPKEPSSDRCYFPHLNKNQESIINDSVNAKEYYLIQGPPGTGKTSTILPHIVKTLLNKDGSIVIVAFTNKAVNTISENLRSADIPFLQMGSRGSEAEKMLRQHCKDGSIQKARDYITDKRVFLSTVATLSSRYDMLDALKNDLSTLIVDEASQLTEPQLVGLVMKFPKFILIGDQNQLPPVVAQDEKYYKQPPELLKQAGISDLSMAMFERLMLLSIKRWPYACGMLTTHFRMHEQIADVINPWYAGQLHSGKKEQLSPFSLENLYNNSPWHDALSSGRLVFIPSPTEKTNKFHRTEAERIVELLKCIRSAKGSNFDPAKTVGVVTPWRTQIANIRNLLDSNDELSKINIETVERFQGSENEIIIISLAVYYSGQLGMLGCPGTFDYEDKVINLDRKLLVTISRAINQVILLGDENVIRSNEHYSSVIEKMRRFEMPITVMA